MPKIIYVDCDFSEADLTRLSEPWYVPIPGETWVTTCNVGDIPAETEVKVIGAELGRFAIMSAEAEAWASRSDLKGT